MKKAVLSGLIGVFSRQYILINKIIHAISVQNEQSVGIYLRCAKIIKYCILEKLTIENKKSRLFLLGRLYKIYFWETTEC